MSRAIATMSDAGFAYPGADWLFRHVSWAVNRGELMAVLGRNGRGKSTMIRCFMGWLPLNEGSAYAESIPAFVPQHHAPVFAYSVLDMVLMGRARNLGLLHVPGPKDILAAEEALERVGVTHLIGRDFPTLSGGEQQLVLLARAIVGDSGLLVLDEPGANLDLANQARMVSLTRALCNEGWAAIMITHHPNHVLEAADTVLLMYGEQGCTFGPPQTAMSDASLTALYDIPTHLVRYQTQEGDRFTVANPITAIRQPTNRPQGR